MQIDLAVVGVSAQAGEALMALLVEREFPLGKLHLVDTEKGAGARLEFKGSYLTIANLADFDFSQVQLAIFLTEADISARFVPVATDAGCTVIDASAQFRYEPDVPLVVAEVNPHALEDYRERQIVALPDAATVQLLLALAPLHAAAGVERVNLVTLYAVSRVGKGGVTELATQATALFNMKEIKHELFAQRMAFNVLPEVGTPSDSGYTSAELQIWLESAKVLSNQELRINASAVQVPVFYGHCQTVHLETRDRLDVERAAGILRDAPGVELIEGGGEDADGGGGPSPAVEAAEKAVVFASRLRQDMSHPHGLDLWLVSDNVRRGVALNAIQVAEILVKSFL